jgi:hypothetical protein
VLAELDSVDWAAAFRFTDALAIACPHATGHADADHPCVRGLSARGFDREAVRRVVAIAEGRPHSAPWLGVFELADGRFAALRAGCCGEGWDCHAEGRADVARDLEAILRFALSPAERARLGL